MIHLGVVQAVKQMDGAGAGRSQAYANLAGEFGVRAGHEGGGLFMTCLDEFQIFLRAAEGTNQAVDPVAGITENTCDAPGRKTLQDEVGNSLHIACAWTSPGASPVLWSWAGSALRQRRSQRSEERRVGK